MFLFSLATLARLGSQCLLACHSLLNPACATASPPSNDARDDGSDCELTEDRSCQRAPVVVLQPLRLRRRSLRHHLDWCHRRGRRRHHRGSCRRRGQSSLRRGRRPSIDHSSRNSWPTSRCSSAARRTSSARSTDIRRRKYSGRGADIRLWTKLGRFHCMISFIHHKL